MEIQGMTIREYAAKEGITLGSAYRRVWQGDVKAQQVCGRWFITEDPKKPPKRLRGRTNSSRTE